jgi:hypothetical protein
MLSKDWVLGEHSMKKLVDSTRLVVMTDRERINGQWVRALIDTVADDAAVNNLSWLIQQFRDGFYKRRGERDHWPAKRQKVSGSSSQRHPPSPTTNAFTQDSYFNPNFSPSQHHGPSSLRPSQGKQKCARRFQTAMNVSILFNRYLRIEFELVANVTANSTAAIATIVT